MQLPDHSAHTDRPSLPFIDPNTASRFVRDDLGRLAQLVGLTRRHANRILETKLTLRETDSQRDALHLLARIDGLSRQIEHAAEALRRIERREHEHVGILRPLSGDGGTRPFPTPAVIE